MKEMIKEQIQEILCLMLNMIQSFIFEMPLIKKWWSQKYNTSKKTEQKTFEIENNKKDIWILAIWFDVCKKV